jgi:hypothetical protein
MEDTPANVAPYVFISYARADLAFVSRLSDDLSRHGVETWRDLEQISPGSNWQSALDRGLAEAAAMLFVSSAHFGRSSGWTSAVTMTKALGDSRHPQTRGVSGSPA